jgi:hypothetical protein
MPKTFVSYGQLGILSITQYCHFKNYKKTKAFPLDNLVGKAFAALFMSLKTDTNCV